MDLILLKLLRLIERDITEDLPELHSLVDVSHLMDSLEDLPELHSSVDVLVDLPDLVFSLLTAHSLVAVSVDLQDLVDSHM